MVGAGGVVVGQVGHGGDHGFGADVRGAAEVSAAGRAAVADQAEFHTLETGRRAQADGAAGAAVEDAVHVAKAVTGAAGRGVEIVSIKKF